MAHTTYVEALEPRVLQPRAEKNKTLSNGRSSRNFSLSSERYIVNQINKSQNRSVNGDLNHNSGSFEAEFNRLPTSIDKYESGHHACIVPRDDDIEKSFRVNQDGSMTVEMKVHLTLKEEEMLQWTTTLSRSTVSKRTVCGFISESGNSSFDSNHTITRKSSNVSDGEMKEDNATSGGGKSVGFKDEDINEGFSSTTVGKVKSSLTRTPTPGCRHVDKKASVESVRMVTESGIQESTLGHYSYMERTVDGGTTEGYCVVRHSSSSNSKPIPKPRRAVSTGASNKCSNSSIRSSGVAEVLQIQNNGMEVTEALMHIYETQGCHDNYFANEDCSVDSVPLHRFTPLSESKQSTDSRLHSSNNDCDIDCSWQPPTADSLQQLKEEMLSLSSEPVLLKPHKANNLSSQPQTPDTVNKDKIPKSMNKKLMRPVGNQKSSTAMHSTEETLKSTKMKTKGDKSSKHSSTEMSSSDASVQKKSLNSSEIGEKNKRGENKAGKFQLKNPIHNEKLPKSDSAALVDNIKTNTSKQQHIDIAVARENGHNVNTPFGRPQMKKNMSDILQTKKSTRTISKPKSLTENKTASPKISSEMNMSVSMPFSDPSPAEVHQYVENWLERHRQEPETNTKEAVMDETEPHSTVVFQIGGDSESEGKIEKQTHLDICNQSHCDTFSKSTSCLSVPLCHEWQGTALVPGEQRPRGLCVSMPSVRVDPEYLESKLRSHKSAEAICPDDNETSTSNFLSPQAKLKPVLRQLCSSIQCIRRASDTHTTNLEKSNSLPDFPTQVASVFGSSCKALLSFLSVVTLKDGLQSSALQDDCPLRSASEAMLMMESLQKISAMKDGDEQRASLTDLQSRTSSQLRDRWRDFVTLRERLESEPLSPKVSETEFALDVVSEGSEVFEDQHLHIDELLEELDMPQDLRAEIASTIQQVKHFYPVEESTFVEMDRNESELVELEHFVKASKDDNEEVAEVDNLCVEENNADLKQCNDEEGIDPLPRESNREHCELQTVQPQRKKSSNREENEEVEKEVEDFTKYSDSKEILTTGKENEEDAEEREKQIVKGGEEGDEQKEWDGEKIHFEDPVEKEEEGEVTEDEEDLGKLGEKNESAELERQSEHEETQGSSSVEETDEREGTEETEEEEKIKDEAVGEKRRGEKEIEVKHKKENAMAVEGDENKSNFTEDKVKHTSNGMKEEETDECVGREVEIEVVEPDQGLEESIDQIDEKEEEVTEDENEVAVSRSTGEDDNMENVEEENDKGAKEDSVREAGEDEKEELFDDENEIDVRESTSEEDNDTLEKDEEETVCVAEEEEKGEVIESESEVDAGESTAEEAAEEEGVGEANEADGKSTGEEDVMEDGVELEGVWEADEEEKGIEKEEERKQETEWEEDEEDEEEEEEDVEVKSTKKELEAGVEQSDSEAKAGKIERTGESVDGDDQGQDCQNRKEEAQSFQENTSSNEEAHGTHRVESQTEDFSEGQSEDGKGNRIDSADWFEDDEVGEPHKQISNSLSHPVEISQELLDFVNYALKSSKLIFTYDSQGNLRIEPDSSKVIQTTHVVIPKGRKDSLYGMKRLPSPSTSDLSDYRPETTESGGYKTQDSVDVVSDSEGEASEKPFQMHMYSAHWTDMMKTVEQANPKLDIASNSETLNGTLRIDGSFSSTDLGNEALKNDLSYFSAASSLQADAESGTRAAKCTPLASEKSSPDGVLIDQGRWLLKENHLIRKSPPVSQGMYSKLDSTSTESNPEHNGEDSPHHHNVLHNPLVAISSSELEEMAKPSTPKCTYYNMPHGSDSDPFLDDSSIKSGKRDLGCVQGRGFRVSPVVDTSKTWTNKNGSLSSFASVEFRIPERKVHPERETSMMAQARRTSSGGQITRGSQDSLEALHVRCGQYCPIL